MIKLSTLLFESMSPAEAEYIFSRYGIPQASSLSDEELKTAWNSLAKAHHPDKGGKDIDMRYINAAYDILKSRKGSAGSRHVASDSRVDRSPWVWAGHRGGVPPMDDNGDEPQNVNYIKKQAWEMSGKPKADKSNEYAFWNFDGSYFRGSTHVYAKHDPGILFKISQMVAKWDTPHKSVAVFYYKHPDAHKLFLINHRGKIVDPAKEFSHESFNNNAGNDKSFVEYLRKNL